MTKFYKKSVVLLVFLIGFSTLAFSQTTVSGTIKEVGVDEGIPGANVILKGTVTGTISDVNGNFSLKVNQPFPFTLTISYVGFATENIIIESEASATNIEVSLTPAMLGEIIVTGNRTEESIMSSPVTIEKVDLVSIQQTTAPEFYDALANVKGVQVNSGSLNFSAVNTRGFATIANVRFVQLVDGMDTSAPLLNFPTGNIVGISELDAESMELVPGAASALYGPNAFNGILMMKSKSPFEYQGLSAQMKLGMTRSDAQGESNPLYNFGIRYAKAFNDRIALKVNFSYLKATDWKSNDYITDRANPESTVNLSGRPNFDGLNLYGDEAVIPVPIGGTFGTLDLRRTGFKEEDILDNNDAISMKYDAALHWRLNDDIELILNYRFGGGSSIYQGTEKYALRDFQQSFYKAELKSDKFFVRAYMTETKDGDSWNMSAQGIYMNEFYSPTQTKWAPEYAQTYVLGMQGYLGFPAGDQAASHSAARAFADRNRPVVGTPQYNDLVNQVRGNLFQRNPPGSSFVDNSRLFHTEFNYNFKQITAVDLMVGGNYRIYDLYSDATVFNEDPDGDGAERIKVGEYGVYGQVAKTLGEALRLTASIRYDKNENFDGQVTPRFSAVYTFNEMHNIRASFQTGFRNPDTQAQFIYFPSTGGILLGSTEANASRYGVHNGGAWTQTSYNAFRASGGSLDPITGAPIGGTSSLLITSDLAYVQPEKLKSMELGYKGLLGNNLLIDLNGYYTSYSDFIGSEIVAVKAGTSQKGQPIAAGALFAPYVNNSNNVNSYGAGLGLTYNLPSNFTLTGSYSYATFETESSEGFRAGFNTPENKFSVGLGNRKIAKNLGFNVNFRWQEGFLWESSFGQWNVPEFGVFDAQINYKITAIKTIAKIGGTNLLGGDYRTNLGAPFVGQQFYISLTFDEFLR